MPDQFNISFQFIDNMGDELARAESRWNGVAVWVSKTKFAKLTDAEQKVALLHECIHAIREFTPEFHNSGGTNEDTTKL